MWLERRTDDDGAARMFVPQCAMSAWRREGGNRACRLTNWPFVTVLVSSYRLSLVVDLPDPSPTLMIMSGRVGRSRGHSRRRCRSLARASRSELHKEHAPGGGG